MIEAYYPVVSDEQQVRNLEAGLPAETTFKGLIRTQRFKTKAAVAEAMESRTFPAGELPGMVINRIVTLERDTAALLRRSYPKTDFASVVIFEEGRIPNSPMLGAALMIVGGVTAAVSAVLFLRGWAAAEAAEPNDDEPSDDDRDDGVRV